MKFVLLAILLFSILLYVPLNRQTPRYNFASVIDKHIPLLPWTVWIYVSYYLLIPLSIFILWNTPILNIYILTQIVATLLASVFWKLFPNGVKRPPLSHTNNIHNRLMQTIYHHDKDCNGLPSAHVLHTIIACYFLTLSYPYLWAPLSLIVILIAISTLTTKQHYLLDVIMTPIITFIIIDFVHIIINLSPSTYLTYIIRS